MMQSIQQLLDGLRRRAVEDLDKADGWTDSLMDETRTDGRTH